MKKKDSDDLFFHIQEFQLIRNYERLRHLEAACCAGLRIKFRRAYRRVMREAMNSIRAGECLPTVTPRGYLLARLNVVRRTLWPSDSTGEKEMRNDVACFQAAAEQFASEKRFTELAAHLNVCSALGIEITVSNLSELHRALVRALRSKVG